MAEGMVKKGLSINKPYLIYGLLEPSSFSSRHVELVEEFKRRNWPSGLNHITPMMTHFDTIHEKDVELWDKARVHRRFSLLELLRRCPKCRKQYNLIHGSDQAETLLAQWNLEPVQKKWEGLMLDWQYNTPEDAIKLSFSDALVREQEALAKAKLKAVGRSH